MVGRIETGNEDRVTGVHYPRERAGGRVNTASKCVNGNAQRLRGRRQALIITQKLNCLVTGTHEFDRRKVQSIKRAHRYRKWLQRTREHDRFEFNENQPPNYVSRRLAVRSGESTGMYAIPNFVFEQPTGN
jgi:hypothetical protein